MRLFTRASRGGSAATAASVLCFATGFLHAESLLQIASPDNGRTVKAGSDLIVTIKTPAVAFQSVSLVGDGPFALSTGISAPPYQFTYPIPADFPSGRYRFQAAGVTASGAVVSSNPVEVDIEQADRPKRLQSEWQLLNVDELENSALVIWGIFPDGSKVDLTRSTQITYTSDRPPVAAVSEAGVISAASAGKARITVKYADKILVVTVVVAQNHAR